MAYVLHGASMSDFFGILALANERGSCTLTWLTRRRRPDAVTPTPLWSPTNAPWCNTVIGTPPGCFGHAIPDRATWTRHGSSHDIAEAVPPPHGVSAADAWRISSRQACADGLLSLRCTQNWQCVLVGLRPRWTWRLRSTSKVCASVHAHIRSLPPMISGMLEIKLPGPP